MAICNGKINVRSITDDISFLKNSFLGALRYQFKPSEVALYNISRSSDLKNLGFTLSSFTLSKLRGYFNSQSASDFLISRSLFVQWCSEHGLKCPENFGIIHKNVKDDEAETEIDCIVHEINSAKPGKLVIKVSGKSHGNGCIFIDKMTYNRGTVNAADNSGNERPLRSILRQCTTESGGDISADEYLVQHEVLTQLNSSSINTIRIVTFLTTDGKIEIDGAVLRAGAKGSYVDSWRRGGIAAAVDLESGMVGRGVRVGECRGGRWYKKHPDNDVIIEGVVLPEWLRVLELAKRAAASLPEARWVGWDIAITDEGPVLLEGNSNWALPMMLAHTSGRCPKSWEKRLADPNLPIPRGYISGIKYFIEMLYDRSAFH